MANERVSIANDEGTKKVGITTQGGKDALNVAPITGGVSELKEYVFSDGDESDSTYYYYGFLKADGSWYILRVTSTMTEARYAAGSSSYTTAWVTKSNQSYDYFSEIF